MFLDPETYIGNISENVYKNASSVLQSLILWDRQYVFGVVSNISPTFQEILILSVTLVFRYALYGEVTPKLDVFAFGVVLFEIMSGRVAISGATPTNFGDSSPVTSREGRTLTALVSNFFLMLPFHICSVHEVFSFFL